MTTGLTFVISSVPQSPLLLPTVNFVVSLVAAHLGRTTLEDILASIMDNRIASYGERLLPRVLDDYAEVEPERLYASIPRLATDLSHGFLNITAKDMAHCVDVLAHQVEGVFGRSSNFETICYLGPPDLRGAMIFFAAVKRGYKVRAMFQ